MGFAPKVNVVIPTWKGEKRISRCLDALYKQTFKDFTTTVVVNGYDPSDGTMKSLASYTKLQIIVNLQNVGFATAVNQGIRASSGLYVAVLNDDAFPEPQWLETLVEAIERNPRLGSCASLMVFAHKPDTIQSAGIAIDRAAIAWDRMRGKPVSMAGGPTEVFGASAGAALYRRSMLEQIGLFDERFFAYLEDVDLAWRAQIAGWHSLYVPQAIVHHEASASFGEDSPLKRRLKARNKVWMVAKNAPSEDLPLIFLYDLMAVIYAFLVKRDFYSLLGRIEGLQGIRPFLRDRCPGRPRILEPLALPWQVPRRWQIK